MNQPITQDFNPEDFEMNQQDFDSKDFEMDFNPDDFETQEPKESVPLWERFAREFGDGIGKFVRTWVPKSALDWLDKQSGEKVWDASPLTTDMQEAETTGEKLVGFAGEVAGDLPSISIGGGIAGGFTKGISSTILKRATRGALFSAIYNASQGEDVDPIEAAAFAGLDVATGAIGDKVGKLIKRFKKDGVTPEQIQDVIKYAPEEIESALLPEEKLVPKTIDELRKKIFGGARAKDLNKDEVKQIAKEFGIDELKFSGDKAVSMEAGIKVLNKIKSLPSKTAKVTEKVVPKQAEMFGEEIYSSMAEEGLRNNPLMKNVFDVSGKKGLTFDEVRRIARSDFGVDLLSGKQITKEQSIALEEWIKRIPRDWKKRALNDAKVFKNPTLASYISAPDRYMMSLGSYDIVEQGIKQKIAMENQVAEGIAPWLNNIRKEWVASTKGLVEGGIKKRKEYLWELLNKHETAAEAGLTGDMARIFIRLRSFTNDMLDRTNQVRKEVGLEPIKKVEGYITHIFDTISKKKLSLKYPIPTQIANTLEKYAPEQIFNPTALERVYASSGLMKDPFKALQYMARIDMKQQYLTKPNILFRELLKPLVKNNTISGSHYKYLVSYWNQAILGFPAQVDQLAKESLDKMGVDKIMEKIVGPLGGSRYVNNTGAAIRRLIHASTIWGRVKLPIRNYTQRSLTLGLYDSKSFAKSFLPANKELDRLVENSQFFRISGKQFLEQMPEGMLAKLEALGYKWYGQSHRSNVRAAMKTAYHATKELIDNPKYAKFGWTKEDLLKEMEFGANTTQYFYNMLGMPTIYRSGIGRTFATLQSWWMNYTTKYWREMIHRGVTGKTGWGKEIPTKWRLGAVRHMVSWPLFFGLKHPVTVTSGTALLGLAYDDFALMGALPDRLNPVGQFVVGLMNFINSDSNYKRRKGATDMKNSAKTIIPGYLFSRDIGKALKGKPEELFFYMKQDKTRRQK